MTQNKTEQRMTTAYSEVQFECKHLKDYFGVPIAVASPKKTGPLVQGYVTRRAGAAKQGAIDLGLLTVDGNLTKLGDNIATHARDTYGTIESTLDRFAKLKGSEKRFCEIDDSSWESIAQTTLQQYPVVDELVELLVTVGGDISLPELANSYMNFDPVRAQQTIIKYDSVDVEELYSPRVYREQFVCHLKSLLYHAGILTETGQQMADLTPETEYWSLAQPVWGGDMNAA